MGNKRDIDQGYAWVVLFGASMIYLFSQGSIKSYGIVYTELLQMYKVGSGNTAWIGSIIWILMFASGPFANYFSKTYSFRWVTILGGLLIGSGYVLTGFITRLEYTYLTLGAVAGLGYGLDFAPGGTIISFYFKKRRTLANGIYVSGSGIGTILFPFLYRFLIDTYGLQWALILIGGMLLNICVGACTFRQPFVFHKPKGKTANTEATNKDQTVETLSLIHRKGDYKTDVSKGKNFQRSKLGPDLKLVLFKKTRFTIRVLYLMLCISGYGTLVLFLPAHIKSLGYGSDKAALAISILGACELVSRILVGWFADLKIVPKEYIFCIIMFMSSLFACITPSIENVNYLVIYGGVVGLFPGSFWSLVAVLLIDVVGMENFPEAFGLLSFGLGLVGFLCQPIAGGLNDLTGSWKPSFYFASASLFLAGTLSIAESLFQWSRLRSTRAKSGNDGICDEHLDAGGDDAQSLIDDAIRPTDVPKFENLNAEKYKTNESSTRSKDTETVIQTNQMAPTITLDDV